MTPQERKLVDELFDRLATLENAPRDPDAVRRHQRGPRARAERALSAGADRAGAGRGAQARRRAHPRAGSRARHRAAASRRRAASSTACATRCSGGASRRARCRRCGRARGRRVRGAPALRPTRSGAPQAPAAVRSAAHGQPPWPAAQASGGGSFLGTAAATAAGVVGGALLMNSFRGMFGGQQPGQAHSAFDQPSGGAARRGAPSASGSDLAREAGVDDIGRGGAQRRL